MARQQPSGDRGRTLVDQDHVLQLALGGGHAATARLARAVVPPQTRRQFPLQSAPGDDVDVAVNGFVRGVHPGKIGVIPSETAGDFFRRPAPTQARVNFVSQRRASGDRAVAPAGGPTPTLRRTVRHGGTIVVGPAVERQLPADRPGRTRQPGRDARLGVTGAQGRFQLNAFIQIQMGVGHRSRLRARRSGGKLRNVRRTAKPVLRTFLSFGGRRLWRDLARYSRAPVGFVIRESFSQW